MASDSDKYPATAVEDMTVGDGDAEWGNLSNLFSDGVDAECANLGGGNATSYYLKCTNYGFSIPAGAAIDGVEVELYQIRYPDGPDANTHVYSIKLVKSGAITGDDKSDSWGITVGPTDRTYGGDLWGVALSPTDVNASDFGCVFSIKLNNNHDVFIDSVRMTVTYSSGSGGGIVSIDRKMPRAVTRGLLRGKA